MTKATAIYVRVSSKSQSHASQLPDLERYAATVDGPVAWYRDKWTGKTMNRPGWNKLIADMRAGRIGRIVCWRQDRLGRTARELLALFDELRNRKVELVYVATGMMGLDTPEGRLIAGIIANVAEYDNEVRTERILAGQAVARANGKTWGGSKPGQRKKVTPTQERAIRQLKADGESIVAIARATGLCRSTVYDVLATAEVTA